MLFVYTSTIKNNPTVETLQMKWETLSLSGINYNNIHIYRYIK